MSSIEDGEIVKANSRLIRPPRQQFIFTYIHGITWNDVKNEPEFGEVWDDFREHWIDADYLVAHNAPFDRKVLFTCCDKIRPAEAGVAVSVHGARLPARTGNSSRPIWLTCPEQLGIALKHHDAARMRWPAPRSPPRRYWKVSRSKRAMLGPPSYCEVGRAGARDNAAYWTALPLRRALVEQVQIVGHVFVARVLALGVEQGFAGALVVAAQHVGEALVVEDLRRRAEMLIACA